MKKITIVFLSIMSIVLLSGCSIFQNNSNIHYENRLESFWERYLIEAAYHNIETSNQIQTIHIVGYYYYIKDIGDDTTRFYIGDESDYYVLHAIIEFKDSLNKEAHDYYYKWNYRTTKGVDTLNEYVELNLLDNEVDMNAHINNLKVSYEDEINAFETKYSKEMDETSKLEVKFYNNKFKFEKLKPFLPYENKAVLKDNVVYLLKNDYAVVAKYKAVDGYNDVQIHKEIEGLPVTEVYRYAFKDANIGGLVIPNTIKRIGRESFMNARFIQFSLEKDSLLQVVESKAFYYATFRLIILPISVEVVGDSAFHATTLNRIRIEALEKPEGWHDNWVLEDRDVIWGYQAE